MPAKPHIILYSKPGCHLCEGVYEKLLQMTGFAFELEVRDITTRDDWFAAYQYDIPVLTQACGDREDPLPRFSTRTPVARMEQMLRDALKL